MTDMERLVELIKQAKKQTKNANCDIEKNMIFADYLLENGVIVPPCKVGDVVYFVARNSGEPIGDIDEVEIVMIGKTEKEFCAKGKLGENTFDIYPGFEIDNYTFYASREEAEKALRGGGEG